MPLFQAKAATEAYLRESGMPYTILGPDIFMEVWVGMLVGMPLQAGQPVTLVVDFDYCGRVIPGDIDLDGRVNLEDFARFAACYGLTESSGESCPPRELLCSDLTGDGIVSLDDFYTLAVRYGQQGQD